MPNHAHVVLTLRGERLPTQIMGSWKSYSAEKINQVLGRRRDFWQEEGFDHLVRGPVSFDRVCRYVRDNPRAIPDWPWAGGDGKRPIGWENR